MKTVFTNSITRNLCQEPKSAVSHKDKGRTRKVHILILASSLESSTKITRDLSNQSKTLSSNGRLMVRLTPSELLELTMQPDNESLIIPSHVLTPWYGLLGPRSGYDSLEDYFR